MYIQNTYTQRGAENSLFQFCLATTEPFSPFYLEEMKVLTFSRTVNQLIMRVHKPKGEYKLALQEKPQVLEDMFMHTYASSRVKRKSFCRKSEVQTFLLISGGHIGTTKRCTNVASPYKALQRCMKRFGK